MGNVFGKSEEPKKEVEGINDEHKIPIEELFQRLEVNPETGLSMTEAQRRHDQDGPNAITPPKRPQNESILTWLKDKVPQNALCIRDGAEHTVAGTELCVGDIVVIKSGDVVPADVRIIDLKDFKVDNSELTGESNPQSRTSEFTHENPLETNNLAFMSTKVVEGTCCKAVVIKIGDATVIGQIAPLASDY